MSPTPFRVTKIVERTKQFEKQLKKLDRRLQSEFRDVVRELLTGSLAAGRYLEKKEGKDNVYTVRLNDSIRFAFYLNPDNSIKPLAVGSHDRVYRQN